jgi:putative peptidoglycan lipid II flippase
MVPSAPHFTRLERRWPLLDERVVGLVATLIVLNKGVSYLREQSLARVFGAGGAFDAYAIAIAVTGIVFGVVATALATVLVPFVKRVEAASHRERERALASVLGVTVALLAVVSTAQALLATPLVALVAPGLSASAAAQAAHLLVLLAPTTAMMGFWVVAGALLNTAEEFALPIYVPVFMDTIIVGAVLGLGHRVGTAAIAAGFAVGGAVQTCILLAALKRRRLLASPRAADLATAGWLLLAAAPVAATNLLAQGLQVIDKYYASHLATGVISCLHYALLTSSIPTGIFSVAIATVVFPRLAGHVAGSEWAAARATSGRALAWSLGLGLFGGLVLALGARPIVALLFGRGAFGATAVRTTAQIVRFQSPMIPALSAAAVLEKAHYSRGRNTQPLIAMALATSSFVGCQWLLPLVGSQIAGPALIALGYAAYGVVYALALVPGYGRLFTAQSKPGGVL